jgi:hypothetical protein
MRHSTPLLAALAALITTTLLSACGSSTSSPQSSGSTSSGGSVTFTGDVTGTWKKAGESTESTCSPTESIIHIQGPGSGDEGDLHVKSDGSVWLDAEKYGDFTSTSGGTLQPSRGLTVNADISTARGKKAHVTGSLSC